MKFIPKNAFSRFFCFQPPIFLLEKSRLWISDESNLIYFGGLERKSGKNQKKTNKKKDLKDKSTEELSTKPLKIPTKPFKLLPKIRKFMENSLELSQKICIKVLKDSQFQIYPGKLLPHLAQSFLFFGNVSFYLGFLLILATFLGILLGFFSLF